MYALPAWAFKPHLSHTSCEKGRAGGKIGGKKGRSSKRGGTRASSIVTASV